MKHIVFIVLSMSLLACTFIGCFNRVSTSNNIYVDSSGEADYHSIQEAINSIPTNDGNYTIIVKPGVYRENIIIDKPISLIGSDPSTTIIEGTGNGSVIYINETGRATIKGFTIKNSGDNGYPGTPDYAAGIRIESNDNTITDNIIVDNQCGIYAVSAQRNNISYNIIKDNREYGIYIYVRSSYTIIHHNVFLKNQCGLRIKHSEHCLVYKNVFMGNEKGLYFCCGATNNTIFHNTFINNTEWSVRDNVGGNHWDNGLEGNYWFNHNNTDSNNDGIADTPYIISADAEDRYPLMQPVVTYDKSTLQIKESS